jgi:hypothetical protein
MALHVLPLLFALSGQVAAPPQQAPPPAQVQKPAPAPRKFYNETADAKAQIAAAVNAIKDDGTRVLIVWGANDDEKSAAFPAALYSGPGTTPEVAQQLRALTSDEFRIVYVDVGHMDKNQDAAQKYAHLAEGGLPYLTVLDKTGEVLVQQATREFLAEPGSKTPFDSAKIAAFLAKHQAPPPPAAAPLFKAAIEQGRREGKTVFVWFSAPW